MPAPSTKPSTAKAPAKKRSTTSKAKPRKRKPAHAAIAERAYFIHLEDGSSDDLANWLRAEQELKAA